MKKMNKNFKRKLNNVMFDYVGPFVDGAIHHAGVMFPIWLITKPTKSVKGNIAFQILNGGLIIFETWKQLEYSDCTNQLYDNAHKHADPEYLTWNERLTSCTQTLNEETETKEEKQNKDEELERIKEKLNKGEEELTDEEYEKLVYDK